VANRNRTDMTMFNRCSTKSIRLSKYTPVTMAYAMAKPGAPDGIESRTAMKNRICASFLALRKTPKPFQLALMYFRANYTRVEASRHSAKALLSRLPLPSVRVRDASGRHQNIEIIKILLRTPKRKTPGKIPRAFAMLGRSAWPISDKSGLVYGFVIEWKHAALLLAAFERWLALPRA
jgi:hypothetical protein